MARALDALLAEFGKRIAEHVWGPDRLNEPIARWGASLSEKRETPQPS